MGSSRKAAVPGAGAIPIRFRETGYRFCYSAVKEEEHETGPRFDPALRRKVCRRSLR